MNMEQNPNVEELRELIKSCNDRAGHHVVWVAKNGDVRILSVPKDKRTMAMPPEMQLRSETFEAGNEYVGPDAANDDEWVKQLFGELKRKWPTAKGRPTVEYIDQF
jgi:hypothetical protein